MDPMSRARVRNRIPACSSGPVKRRKIGIEGHHDAPFSQRPVEDLGIVSRAETDIDGEDDINAFFLKLLHCSPWYVGIRDESRQRLCTKRA